MKGIIVLISSETLLWRKEIISVAPHSYYIQKYLEVKRVIDCFFFYF